MEHGEIKVEIKDDFIVATMPGTSFRTSYCKSPNEPKLIQSTVMEVDKDAPVSRKEFETLAWEAANAAARELGWS
jgi:hypothetical protein